MDAKASLALAVVAFAANAKKKKNVARFQIIIANATNAMPPYAAIALKNAYAASKIFAKNIINHATYAVSPFVKIVLKKKITLTFLNLKNTLSVNHAKKNYM